MEKKKVNIYIKKTKTNKSQPDGTWMCYAYFTYYVCYARNRDECIKFFVENLHLRHYDVIEL